MGESNESVLRAIKHYQESLERHGANENDSKILYYLNKLSKLPIKMSHLESTGVGRSVNSLRKYPGIVGDSSRALVSKWKEIVVEEEDQEASLDGHEQDDSGKSSLSSCENEEIENLEKEVVPIHKEASSSHRDSDRSRTSEKSKKSKHRSKSDNRKDSSSHSKDSHHDRRNHDEITKWHKCHRPKPDSDSSDSNEDNSRTKQRKNSSSSEPEVEIKHRIKEQAKRRRHRDSSDSSDEEDCKKSKSKKHKSDNSECEARTSSDDEQTSHKSKKSSKHKRSKSKHSHSKKDETKRESSKHIKDEPAKEKSDKHKKDDSKKSDSKKPKDSSSRKEKSSSKSEEKSSNKHKSSGDKKDKSKISKTVETFVVNGIDSGSGASFAEALGMCAPALIKSSTTTKKPNTYKPTPSTSTEKPSTSKEKPVRSCEEPVARSNVPKLLKEPALEPLDINLSTLLPSITPNYRPIGSTLHETQQKRTISDYEALSRSIASKNQRTKVYSGNKTAGGTVPSLFEICIRLLQDNIDALEYTGGVPYLILKPIIEKANADQLYMLEHHNPYLLVETDELWQLHCQKEFRNKERQEMETWRDMYMRCLDEREAKLKALTANIKQAQDKTLPVRTTKLAYVNDVVKPPRNIARKQIKNGTTYDKKPALTPAGRLSAIATAGDASKVTVPNPGSRAMERSGGSHGVVKQKRAPLMAKTLSLFKNRFKR